MPHSRRYLIRSSAALLAFAAVLAFSAGTPAQETGQQTGKRVPAQMLPAEMAGILLSEGRPDLEQPEKSLDFLGLRDGDVVADIGCGNGFYTLRLAERVGPTGKVLAVDVQQGMLDQLDERMSESNREIIRPILGTPTDPRLPAAGVDWILLVDVYHEFSDPEAMLAAMKASLAPGGRVALLEYRAEQDPATIPFNIPRDHKMTIDEVMGEWVPAGFELVNRAEFLPAQHLFIFKVAEDVTRPPVLPIKVGATLNVSTFGHRVFFAGQPDAEALRRFADMGVKTVINLRGLSEMESLDFDEPAVIQEEGMKYVNLPVGRELPTGQTRADLLDALAQSSEAPVLIHCASSNRVGTVWSLYAGLRDKLDPEKALAEGAAAGMRAPAFVEAVRSELER